MSGQPVDIAKAYDLWMLEHPTSSQAIAAIQALNTVLPTISASQAEFHEQMNAYIKQLQQHIPDSLSVKNASIIFYQYVSRADFNTIDTDSIKNNILSRGTAISSSTLAAPITIQQSLSHFLHDETTVLVHGYNPIIVDAIIQSTVIHGRRLSLLVTECRPECQGYIIAHHLKQYDIPVTIILDSSIGHIMPLVDAVLLGSEGVVENGGIVNTTGTYTTSMIAYMLKKPVYVAAESIKFERTYIFNQTDVEHNKMISINKKKSSNIMSSPYTTIVNNNTRKQQSTKSSPSDQQISTPITTPTTTPSTTDINDTNTVYTSTHKTITSYDDAQQLLVLPQCLDFLSKQSHIVDTSHKDYYNHNKHHNNTMSVSSLLSPANTNTPTTTTTTITTNAICQDTNATCQDTTTTTTATCQDNETALTEYININNNISHDDYFFHLWDYTPPQYITLLFTDLGVLSPSAVSDELHRLYY